MPGGSEPLVSRMWQPVPDCRETQVYPLIRKVDAISSDAYLIRTPDALVLIDPGDLAEQATHLAAIIRQIHTEKPLPLLVVLTHAHTDHFLATPSISMQANLETFLVAIHTCGAQAVESADRGVTQAELMDREIPPLRIDLRLFSETGDGREAPVRQATSGGTTFTVVRESPAYGLAHELIHLGGGSSIEVYHTPGHSPDSCCIRIGGLLFIGDLLFAASPGMAGIRGWNQEALLVSLDGVEAFLSHGGITAVCPGHGRVLTTEDATRMLRGVRKDAHLLSSITEMNRERSRKTAAFAEDCMDQVHELFTVMTGRLYFVSFVLDELGERETATGVPAFIRGEVIDDLLDSFAAFTREYHASRQAPIHLALKGGQVIGKLERSFDQSALAQIIDPTLVQRAGRLLADYTTMLRGFNPPPDRGEYDLRDLLRTCIADHTLRRQTDEDALAATDDDATFGRLLLARIGTPPLLEDVTVTFEASPKMLNVAVDRVRFLDLVTYLLEDLVGTGATAVTIRAGKEDASVVATLSGTCGETPATCGGDPRRYLYWLGERAGGALHFEEMEGSRSYSIRFPSAA
ncbi:MAG: MBL fold metallo-hydrolase [Methanomicrobiales archaeon]|nr:MBL fold metallo-hydrolase [Methanomicrobiales archaeon]